MFSQKKKKVSYKKKKKKKSMKVIKLKYKRICQKGKLIFLKRKISNLLKKSDRSYQIYIFFD
jgi:hypothetical protein